MLQSASGAGTRRRRPRQVPPLGEGGVTRKADDWGMRPHEVPACDSVAASYRDLAEIYHDLLSREGLDQLLERIVKTVRQLIPVASILIAEAHTEERALVPLVAEGEWPDGFLESRLPFGEGLIGFVAERGKAILCNEAHNDPRAGHVAGTPIGEPEAIISLPLVARGVVIGAMSLYREGEGARFSDFEFEVAQRFGDAATLALENTRIREELRELTRRDELTGLLNRRGFGDLISNALAGKDMPVALILVDLDDFKNVNDCHGHLCGDEILRQVADRLRMAAREEDHVCRLGGDEFAVILTGADQEQAATVAERIEAAIAQEPFPIGNQLLQLTASVGRACADPVSRDVEAILGTADNALYTAKELRHEPVSLQLVRATRHP